ncbi:MAG: sulfite exporter TauE/SafE family protein [Pegethrix bostrychoides GSE-TBD4-15B]|jgi:hypothetical protein|uniref:Sulfite exporter TauE/SafE family protein n=1 Tax=Pegethrix bostrychoides GSE-TBD4-15B TaxID=2839662 RepID=A0A951PFL0_9CYAN|nr:sulfite exporter TauE/SafE family protein [Pegethrix bostrychoides GSE-TBD4-15B]
MLDFLLIFSLGFFGSFGHCASMCGPIVSAFALSATPALDSSRPSRPLSFHLLLNLGRLLSYLLTGAGIGALGSVLLAGGQLAGIGSGLRQLVTVLTGLLLIWLGLNQICPDRLLKLPFLHPLAGRLHQSLSHQMVNLSLSRRWWTPFLLGAVWGLIPCGFLYAAQIKAAETSSLGQGAFTMLAFGLGTLPTMLAVGLGASRLSSDRRSQLFRMGGWITLGVGLLTLLRTGNTMVDFTGHVALAALALALAARPISRIWAAPLRYRRALGVGAFLLALAHTLHMVEHAWNWKLEALLFMLPQHQWGIWAGGGALLLMLPAAATSFDGAQRLKVWRGLHLLAVPALCLTTAHCLMIGSHYLGGWQLTVWNWLAVGLLLLAVAGVLLLRIRGFWSLIQLENYYAAPIAPSKFKAGQSAAD